MSFGEVAAAFLTVAGTIFLAELADKDALVLLTLGTRVRPLVAFAAGVTAFSISSTVIVLLASVVASLVPTYLIKLAGGAIMVGYGAFTYARRVKRGGERSDGASARLSTLSTVLGIVMLLVALDLAGDATELLTIVFVAQYRDAVLVFSAAVLGLVFASAVEVTLGNRLGRLLSARTIAYVSVAVSVALGCAILASAFASLP